MPFSDNTSSTVISLQSAAEIAFLVILIFMVARPLSGAIAWTNSSLSFIARGSATKVESTKNLARELLAASDRIRLLEKGLADAQLELTKLRQEARDVNKLRALLDLRQAIDRKTIGADVISRSPDNWYEQITLDKGQQDNVQVGSGVVTNQGIVGQVVSVGKTTSIVRLISDPEQKTGTIIERLNLPGVLRGNYKNSPIIEYIPVGSSVDIGDKITCLSNGGIFPPGHPVGTVSMVRRDTNGTTLSIEIKPSENLYDLTHVLIVPPINI